MAQTNQDSRPETYVTPPSQDQATLQSQAAGQLQPQLGQSAICQTQEAANALSAGQTAPQTDTSPQNQTQSNLPISAAAHFDLKPQEDQVMAETAPTTTHETPQVQQTPIQAQESLQKQQSAATGNALASSNVAQAQQDVSLNSALPVSSVAGKSLQHLPLPAQLTHIQQQTTETSTSASGLVTQQQTQSADAGAVAGATQTGAGQISAEVKQQVPAGQDVAMTDSVPAANQEQPLQQVAHSSSSLPQETQQTIQQNQQQHEQLAAAPTQTSQTQAQQQQQQQEMQQVLLGQQQNPQTQSVSQNFVRNLFDRIKRGVVPDILNMVRENSIDIAQLKDEQNFGQSAMFSASVVKDSDAALAMAIALHEQGVNPGQADSLNQTPMYYAVREGHFALINWFIEKKLTVNQVDTYGQTPIFYCIREGNIPTTQKLIELGADCDYVDNNGQTPIYYAIKHNQIDMVEFLIKKGVNLQIKDNKNQSLVQEASKKRKPQIVELLVQSGAPAALEEKKEKAGAVRKVKSVVAEQPKERQNERKIPKTYLLTTLREGGYYEPLTDEEFEKFRKENPDIAKYFEVDAEDEDVAPLDELTIPDVPEHAPIFDHWEKAASRCLMALSRNAQADIFMEPVDWKGLKIPDYPTIITNPMDFGTVKSKLKEHKYKNVREFMYDMELVFSNCATYNAPGTYVAQSGKAVHEEYQRLVQQLYLNFYL